MSYVIRHKMPENVKKCCFLAFYDIWYMTKGVINFVIMGIIRTVLLSTIHPLAQNFKKLKKSPSNLQKCDFSDFPFFEPLYKNWLLGLGQRDILGH